MSGADWLAKIFIFSKTLTHPAAFSTGKRGLLGMIKKIGTHDGKFHADEAFACALLRMTKEFRDSRTATIGCKSRVINFG